eukprot:GFYU01008376.1.p1 GENE.GFYU01008376.1~~GFYU01008376.1.p1  ORF type:complete len:713 (+),score=237.74 GFYU01008376.1:502-2640(+)
MYLAFQRTLTKLLFVFTIVCTVILVPVNNSDDNNFRNAQDNDTLDLYTIGFFNWTSSNVQRGSPLLWAHFVVLILATCAAYSLILQHLRRLRQYRAVNKDLDAELSEREAITKRTIMIEGLPEEIKEARHLYNHFNENVTPNQAQAASLAFDLRKMTAIKEKYTDAEENVVAAEALKKLDPSNPPTVKVGSKFSPVLGTPVDAVDHYGGQVEQTHEQLAVMASECDDKDSTGVAFITFNNPKIAKRCVQNFHFKSKATQIKRAEANSTKKKGFHIPGGVDDVLKGVGKLASKPLELMGFTEPVVETPDGFPATVLDVSMAPYSHDLIWANFALTADVRFQRQLLFGAITFWLVIFWAIPIGFLGSLDSLSTLPGIGKAFEFLADLDPAVRGFLQAYLPTLVLLVFQAMLPKIMTAFTMGEGVRTKSVLEAGVMSKLFTFQLFSFIVLPAVFIGGLDQLKALADEVASDPFGEIMRLLTKITSPQSGVFISFVIQSGLISASVKLLRPGPLIVTKLLQRMAKTTVQMDAAMKVEDFEYQVEYAQLLIVFAISTLFCITLPLTPLFGLLYFVCKGGVDKINLHQVHPVNLPRDGYIHTNAIRLMVIVTACMQGATCGMFASKLAPTQFALSVVFVVLTYFLVSKITATMADVYMQDLVISEPLIGTGSDVEDGGSSVSAYADIDFPFLHPALSYHDDTNSVESTPLFSAALATE